MKGEYGGSQNAYGRMLFFWQEVYANDWQKGSGYEEKKMESEKCTVFCGGVLCDSSTSVDGKKGGAGTGVS